MTTNKKTSDAQTRASRKWEKRNKIKTRKDTAKRAAKSYIRKYAQMADLIELERLIKSKKMEVNIMKRYEINEIITDKTGKIISDAWDACIVEVVGKDLEEAKEELVEALKNSWYGDNHELEDIDYISYELHETVLQYDEDGSIEESDRDIVKGCTLEGEEMNIEELLKKLNLA